MHRHSGSTLVRGAQYHTTEARPYTSGVPETFGQRLRTTLDYEQRAYLSLRGGKAASRPRVAIRDEGCDAADTVSICKERRMPLISNRYMLEA